MAWVRAHAWFIYDELMNMWAARLWWMLRHYGFTNAAVLNGGSHKWKQEGRPLSQDVVAHAPAQFTPVRDGAPLFVGKDDVLAGITDAGTCLVDAMTAESCAPLPMRKRKKTTRELFCHRPWVLVPGRWGSFSPNPSSSFPSPPPSCFKVRSLVSNF